MKNIIIGIITGFISGMFSSGGGLILVPVLITSINTFFKTNYTFILLQNYFNLFLHTPMQTL